MSEKLEKNNCNGKNIYFNMKGSKTMSKREKGITLVALVVTIVVLLVLAGVSINLVLGDNGIIKKAKEAKKKTEEASQNDLTAMDSLVGEINYATREELPKNDETAPYYPDNTFTKVEGTIDTGLVIQDSKGNEYVWVVVPKTLYDNTNYNSNGTKKPSSSTDYANIEYCLQQYTSVYRNGTSCSDTWAADTSNEGWFTEAEYNTEKNNMLKSVYENGGFYVGRYEAGIEENRTSPSAANSNGKYDITGLPTPLSQADAYPYTHVTRTQAQKLAENVNSGNYTSSLMFEVQWDLVLAFMAKDTNKITSTDILTSNSVSIGNYIDSEFKLNPTGKYLTIASWTPSKTWNLATVATKDYVNADLNKIIQYPNGNGILVTTGTSEQNKVMNIYDIAGNMLEWTLENTENTNKTCAVRGGYSSITGYNLPAAAYDSYNISANYYNAIGFRVSIW